MEVKEAVRAAKRHIRELYESEDIRNVGLEEVEVDDDGDWRVTIGFSRPWDLETKDIQSDLLRGVGVQIGRSYKVVRIKDLDGRIMSVTAHPVEFS